MGRDVGEDLGHWRPASGNSLDVWCTLGTGSHGAAATPDICCHSVTKAAKWLVVERHADTQIPQFARRRKSSNETPHRPGNTSCSSSPGPHPVPEKQVVDDTGLWWDTQHSKVPRGLVARQRGSPAGRWGKRQDRVRPTTPALRSLRQGDCTVSSGLFGLHSEPLSQQRGGSVCIERCLRYTEWKREKFTFLFSL